ncbi:MAG: exosortase-associated EpsI family protein [Planctomycetota bacterium]
MISRENTIRRDLGWWWVWILAVLLLTLSGAAYRVLAARLHLVVSSPIKLPVPLSAFPTKIGKWTGEDIPIPQNIQRAAGNDDFINRLYIDKANNEWVNLYLAYTARPRSMLGHRPEICYVAGGWVHDSTQTSEFIAASGKRTGCLIQCFHRPAPQYQERFVLNYYILNGQLVCDERGFSGLGWRTPNISGDPARYVAQVQISSVLESSATKAAVDMTDLILEFFPDENGKVRATKYTGRQSNILK